MPMLCLLLFLMLWPAGIWAATFDVPEKHPYLFGSQQALKQLARQRTQTYAGVKRTVEKQAEAGFDLSISQALLYCIEDDKESGLKAIQSAMQLINGPIKVGHIRFGGDLALCAVVYDLCYPLWTEQQKQSFWEYTNKTVDQNITSERAVFHNAWYGYKHFGIGLAALASYHDNPRAPEILKTTQDDYTARAAPALNLAGDGGGWAEGYYINYWSYEWLWYCECLRRVTGVDNYLLAPKFYSQRALAAMFETYPGIGIYQSRRSVPMGDGGGRVYGGDRDRALANRLILSSYYKKDPAHQVVHAFNELTPQTGTATARYIDFLWRDANCPKGDLDSYKLSHYSPGAGYIYARSSWADDATYFFFKCGDRFTAHQHLDNGNFIIYKHQELLGDGGHYDGFGSSHDVNYHLRSIAHNTLLIKDPQEVWPGIRAGTVTGNDGGQHHQFPHHNGSVSDVAAWQNEKAIHDIGDILAFEDSGSYLYLAADMTRSYAKNKVNLCTRQIVFIRPATFIIIDHVSAKKPEYKKTFVLQAMKTPQQQGDMLAITNGKGRLFVQTLLPATNERSLHSGDDLYRYDEKAFPPAADKGPAPECRVEISPVSASTFDLFLHVCTATDSATNAVPSATLETKGQELIVILGGSTVSFDQTRLGGSIAASGNKKTFATAIVIK